MFFLISCLLSILIVVILYEFLPYIQDLFKTSKDKIYALIGAGFALILFILSIIKI